MITRGQGHFFTQEDMSEGFSLLTCTGVGDLPLPTGDLTAQYCPNPDNSGTWVIDGYVAGEPATPTTTLVRPLMEVSNFLLDNRGCEFNGLVPYVCEGDISLPQNFMIAMVVIAMRLTNPAVLAAAAMQPGDDGRVETNADVAYIDRLPLYNQTITVQSLSNTADGNGITFLPHACPSDCSSGRDLCDEGYIGLDGTQYNSEVKYTTTGGATWTQTTTDPFLYDGGNAGKPILVGLTDAHRVIVPRISQAIGEAAEIAYSEDWGVTWTNIYVGTVGFQAILKLFIWQGVIWAACTHGYVYVSTDLGDTWTAQEEGVETGETLRDGVMYTSRIGYAVGDNNAFLYTLNGGSDWNLRIGPSVGADLLSVSVNRRGWVFVGASDGNMYYSTDQGATWATRHEFGIGTVDWIAFYNRNRYIGYAIWNDGDGVGWLYRSFDGGATWHRVPGQTAAWNSGLNDGHICDQNNAFVVGETHDGNTFVAQAVPAS